MRGIDGGRGGMVGNQGCLWFGWLKSQKGESAPKGRLEMTVRAG